MSSRLLGPNGVQILPEMGDLYATHTAWRAHMCADADHRVKHPIIAGIAAELIVERVP